LGAVRHYTRGQISRTLKKHDTKETKVEVSETLQLSMVQSADTYALLDRLIEQEQEGRKVTRFPYWAEIWPSSLALSRWFAATSPNVISPTMGRALELGCGLGLVGVAMARMGWHVEATDFVEDALMFAVHNAERNGACSRHTVSYLDWAHPVGASHSLLVGSDVAYEKSLHPFLLRTLRALLEPGGQLILSDPGRPATRPFLEALEQEGYTRRQDQIEVRWNALDHRVDIHSFIRPA
jgi:predicted nicotinamide N-methyase